jgi:hypothetical protein
MRCRSQLANGKIITALSRSRLDVQLTFVNFAALTQNATHVATLCTDLGYRARRCVWVGLSRLDRLGWPISGNRMWIALALVFGFSTFLSRSPRTFYVCEHEQQQQKSRLSSFLGHGVLLPACFFVGNNSWDKGLVDLALGVYDRLFFLLIFLSHVI